MQNTSSKTSIFVCTRETQLIADQKTLNKLDAMKRNNHKMQKKACKQREHKTGQKKHG